MLRCFLLVLSGTLLIILLNAASCATGKGVSDRNVSFVYKKEPGLLNPSYSVFHESGAITLLFYKLKSADFLYSKIADKEGYHAKFSITWRLKDNYQSKVVLDSGTVVNEDEFNNDPEQILEGFLRMNIPEGKNYVVEIELYDVNRMSEHLDFLVVEKTNLNERQNFMVSESGKRAFPIFRSFLQLNEKVLCVHRSKTTKLFVRYYNREFSLPPPPFSYYSPKGFDFKADSLFVIESNGADLSFSPPRPGIYHFQTDTSQTDGLTLICFKENYPRIKTYEGMVPPLRYLTSKNEYEKMMRYANKKAAVDSFWLSSGGSIDRGKDLIRKFYNRVYEANDHFTSYVEGWRTDRGLVYLVYGSPNVLYRSNTQETWVYGEENNINALSFTFTRVLNPFSGNDFRLERSPTYQDGWYKAANAWRDGRIFIDN